MTRFNNPARFGLLLGRFADQPRALPAVTQGAQRLTRQTQEVSG